MIHPKSNRPIISSINRWLHFILCKLTNCWTCWHNTRLLVVVRISKSLLNYYNLLHLFHSQLERVYSVAKRWWWCLQWTIGLFINHLCLRKLNMTESKFHSNPPSTIDCGWEDHQWVGHLSHDAAISAKAQHIDCVTVWQIINCLRYTFRKLCEFC